MKTREKEYLNFTMKWKTDRKKELQNEMKNREKE
jgi:hypothetical protein